MEVITDLKRKRRKKLPFEFENCVLNSRNNKSFSTKAKCPSSFSCEYCKTSHFLKNTKKSQPLKRRWFFDQNLNKKVTLCNACGLKTKRNPTSKTLNLPLQKYKSEKDEYLKQGRDFGRRLSVISKEEDANTFFCPKFRRKGCGCLQTFIMSSSSNLNQFIKSDTNNAFQDIQANEENSDEIVKRAKLLLRYHKRAKELISALNSSDFAGRPGSKRSKEFEDFILTNRDYLKTQLRLCEPAVQRILVYSNNFLYKSSGKATGRISKKMTIGSPWLQKSIKHIYEEHEMFCKNINCVKKTEELKEQVGIWRERSSKSKKDVRLVIQEMWVTSENIFCKKFLQCVTGAGISLIVRLSRNDPTSKNLGKLV